MLSVRILVRDSNNIRLVGFLVRGVDDSLGSNDPMLSFYLSRVAMSVPRHTSGMRAVCRLHNPTKTLCVTLQIRAPTTATGPILLSTNTISVFFKTWAHQCGHVTAGGPTGSARFLLHLLDNKYHQASIVLLYLPRSHPENGPMITFAIVVSVSFKPLSRSVFRATKCQFWPGKSSITASLMNQLLVVQQSPAVFLGLVQEMYPKRVLQKTGPVSVLWTFSMRWFHERVSILGKGTFASVA